MPSEGAKTASKLQLRARCKCRRSILPAPTLSISTSEVTLQSLHKITDNNFVASAETPYHGLENQESMQDMSNISHGACGTAKVPDIGVYLSP